MSRGLNNRPGEPYQSKGASQKAPVPALQCSYLFNNPYDHKPPEPTRARLVVWVQSMRRRLSLLARLATSEFQFPGFPPGLTRVPRAADGIEAGRTALPFTASGFPRLCGSPAPTSPAAQLLTVYHDAAASMSLPNPAYMNTPRGSQAFGRVRHTITLHQKFAPRKRGGNLARRYPQAGGEAREYECRVA